MFLLFAEFSLYGVIGFIVTILLDSLIVKLFLKEKGIKFAKILSEISFVKIPTILVAMILGGVLSTLIGLVTNLMSLSINPFYLALIGFILVYIYMYNSFLVTAISNLKATINNSKRNTYIISILSLIVTIIMNIFVKIILPILAIQF